MFNSLKMRSKGMSAPIIPYQQLHFRPLPRQGRPPPPASSFLPNQDFNFTQYSSDLQQYSSELQQGDAARQKPEFIGFNLGRSSQSENNFVTTEQFNQTQDKLNYKDAQKSLATLYISTGKYNDAIEVLKKLIPEFGNDGFIQISLGNCYGSIGNYPKAIEHL